MKEYVKTHNCRQKELLKHFDYFGYQHDVPHLCCDNCAALCHCRLQDCKGFATYPVQRSESPSYLSVQQREVNAEETKDVQDCLILYYKSLVIKLPVNTTAYGKVKTLANLQFMLGFFKYQIAQVMENMGAIFSLSDVYKFVEIWDKRHAMKIISVINYIFNDGNTESQSSKSTSEDNEYNFEEEFLDEWQEILQDDFFDKIFDNLSLSQLENSFLDNENASSDSQETGVPSAVLATVEAMHLNDQL